MNKQNEVNQISDINTFNEQILLVTEIRKLCHFLVSCFCF